MDEEEIFRKIQETIVDQLAVDPEEVHSDAYFLQDLGADSFYMVEFAEAIEDLFGIRIPEEDLESIETVGDAVRYIKNRLEE
jgi:acyl carrier protein